MKMEFEQPIPGREVYINRKTGTVVGDGNPFSSTELLLLRGEAKQDLVAPQYTEAEQASIDYAEAELGRTVELREGVRARHGKLLEQQRDARLSDEEGRRLTREIHEAKGALDRVSELEGKARVVNHFARKTAELAWRAREADKARERAAREADSLSSKWLARLRRMVGATDD